MGEKRLKHFLIVLAIFSFLSFISADFEIGNPPHSITTEYSSGELIKGWVNISFSNESNYSVFNDSFENSITLIELLNENPDFQYEVNATYATIDSIGFQKLYLDNGSFFTSSTPGDYTYQLNFSNQEIFSETIVINSSVGDVNVTLNEKLDDLDNIKTEIDKFDLFYRIGLNSALNIDGIEEELGNLTTAYESAVSENELEEIWINLSKIKIPKNISITTTAEKITFYPNQDDINLNILETIGGGSYETGEESTYKNSIVFWHQENIDTKISFNELSASYNDSEIAILRVFDLEIDKKSALNYTPYIIFPKMNDIKFKQDYKEIEEQDYIYISFTGTKKIFTFSTTEDVSFSDLPLFISPALSELVLTDIVPPGPDEEEEKMSKWVIFSLVILLLALIGFMVYVFLQIWYKKKYENYLFGDKNKLYNIATYIHHAKEKGLDNREIFNNLRKVGWSYEQVRYAMRKYIGKRTGMYEIPVGKILEKKKRKQSFPGKREFPR